MLELETKPRYANDQVVKVKVVITFYPSQWASHKPRWEPYIFECIGVVRITRRYPWPRFYVDGAMPDKPLPSGPHRHTFKGAIIKPLTQALEAEMGIPVVPFQAMVIGEGK